MIDILFSLILLCVIFFTTRGNKRYPEEYDHPIPGSGSGHYGSRYRGYTSNNYKSCARIRDPDEREKCLASTPPVTRPRPLRHRALRGPVLK